MITPLLDVAAAVIGRNDSVLVARRGKGQHLEHKWEFPGGKIEENESPEECLHRELREELNVIVEVGDYIGESVFSYSDKRIRLLAYHVKLLSGDISLTVHDRIDWVKIQDLPTVDLAEADIPISLALQRQNLPRSDGNKDYYDLHFQEYNDNTLNIDSEPFLSPLTNHLQQGSTVLDIGCGSGRDLLWLKNRGYVPTGFECSSNLARLARQNSGCPVIEGDFTRYVFSNLKFDALLLVGSLVHLHESEFPEVLTWISKGMKDTGRMYLTLKEGDGLAQRPDGRLDILWRAEGLERIFCDHGFAVLESSQNISAMDTEDVWLGYLLTFNGGR
jgi:mutator protein MutT